MMGSKKTISPFLGMTVAAGLSVGRYRSPAKYHRLVGLLT